MTKKRIRDGGVEDEKSGWGTDEARRETLSLHIAQTHKATKPYVKLNPQKLKNQHKFRQVCLSQVH